MIRELFSIGPLSISPFGVLLALAFLAAYWQLQSGLRRLSIGGPEDASEILIWAGVGGVLGAKIYYAALYRDWSLLITRSGLVWYGGLILGTIAVALAIRRRGLPMAATIDAAAVATVLGYGVGRIGCFLVGDDYGRVTDVPWAVEFPVGLPPTTAGVLRSVFGMDIPAEIPAEQVMAVHPTQLYETIAAIVIWRIGVKLLAMRPAPGSVATIVLGLLAAERFAVEFLRAKDDRFVGTFTLAQIISLLAIVLLAGIWATRRRDHAPASGKG